jgi:GNAT superfamily N-acetyltransferase
MIINDYSVYLEWDKDEASLSYNDPSDFMYEANGRVIVFGDNDKKIIIGKFRTCYINVGAIMEQGESIYDVFDTYAETVDYYGAIFNYGTLEINEKLCTAINCDAFFGNILILDRLEIIPRFRKQGLGLLVMRKLIERFSLGAILVGIKPFPLQFEVDRLDNEGSGWRTKLKLDALPQDRRRATAKLQRYYQKLGFARLPGTPFMFRSTDYPLPKIEDLIEK